MNQELPKPQFQGPQEIAPAGEKRAGGRDAVRPAGQVSPEKPDAGPGRISCDAGLEKPSRDDEAQRSIVLLPTFLDRQAATQAFDVLLREIPCGSVRRRWRQRRL